MARTDQRLNDIDEKFDRLIDIATGMAEGVAVLVAAQAAQAAVPTTKTTGKAARAPQAAAKTTTLAPSVPRTWIIAVKSGGTANTDRWLACLAARAASPDRYVNAEPAFTYEVALLLANPRLAKRHGITAPANFAAIQVAAKAAARA